MKKTMPVMNNQVAINYAIAICAAFQEAHGKGILHKNVRSDSVIVTPKRRPKVLGFGQSDLKDVLKLGSTAGSPEDAAYFSPGADRGRNRRPPVGRLLPRRPVLPHAYRPASVQGRP